MQLPCCPVGIPNFPTLLSMKASPRPHGIPCKYSVFYSVLKFLYQRDQRGGSALCSPSCLASWKRRRCRRCHGARCSYTPSFGVSRAGRHLARPLSLPERGGNNGVVLRVLVSCENARYTVHGTQTSGPIGRAGCAGAGADHATRLAYSPRGLYVIIDAGSGGADAA